MAKTDDDTESTEILAVCANCGDSMLEIYLEDGYCPDCRES
ncbi:hypothetical protein ACFFQF_23585 [Haladaptatus pallidirubidus]|nr:hypothetical protein [Haladaptatus pallidirubidus]